MCHEQWMRRSEQAVERSWLRALSQRDRDTEETEPREPAMGVAEPAELREPVVALEA